MLFTHRGLSGPAILQISSYWREGEEIGIDMLPGVDVFEALRDSAGATTASRRCRPRWPAFLPKRLAQTLAAGVRRIGNLADISDKTLRRRRGGGQRLARQAGGLGRLSHRRSDARRRRHARPGLRAPWQAKAVPGLYFIGEVVDVTGWLGGYNFQWAWSSGWCAGQYA